MTTLSDKPVILVIDDEEALRDGCRQVLEKTGYTVLTAANGNEGINLAREHLPHIAFVDLKMPNISGMEIIEILSHDIPDIMLVMITGYASIVSAVEAMKKGAYDYLPKPFSADQLRALAYRGLEHRRLKIETRILREEKDQIQKNFITFVSHEMRSPLVAIQQYMETLKATAGDCLNQDVREVIERCSARVEGLEKLVEHWLDLSRIENGTFAEQKVALNLRHVILRAAEEMNSLCKKRGLTLTSNIPENIPSIMGDEESLVRVFTNIIGNATKFTPEGGAITISVKQEGHYITADIADTGFGISPDKIPFIFEPFYRGKDKNERGRGSGLGLTFCKLIMESHQGDITVSSKEGEGTTFALKFPVQVQATKPGE
ncbi:MAG: response regulator [Deltaproteobacteria bacterium]|nr:response regulator [Deltaproteobacteria bacterium]